MNYIGFAIVLLLIATNFLSGLPNLPISHQNLPIISKSDTIQSANPLPPPEKIIKVAEVSPVMSHETALAIISVFKDCSLSGYCKK